MAIPYLIGEVLHLVIETAFLTDHRNREYVQIAICEYLSDVYRAAELLFDKLNKPTESSRENSMGNLYEALATDQSGEDIYLSDGVWLSSNGTLNDLGR